MNKIPMGFIKETNEHESEGMTVPEDIKTDMIFEPNPDTEKDAGESRFSVKAQIGSKPEKFSKDNPKLNSYKFKKMKESRDSWRLACTIAILVIGVLVMKIYNSGYIYEIFGNGEPHIEQSVEED